MHHVAVTVMPVSTHVLTSLATPTEQRRPHALEGIARKGRKEGYIAQSQLPKGALTLGYGCQ